MARLELPATVTLFIAVVGRAVHHAGDTAEPLQSLATTALGLLPRSVVSGFDAMPAGVIAMF